MMNKQTKKLDLALSSIKFEVGSVGLQFLSPIVRKEILNVCKESGLKFVSNTRTKHKLNDTGGFYFDETTDIEEINV